MLFQWKTEDIHSFSSHSKFSLTLKYSLSTKAWSEGNKKKNLMKIWSSGRRSDEQQVIIRNETLFVDVILAFHLQTLSRSLALPQKIYKYIFCEHSLQEKFFLFISLHQGMTRKCTQRKRINRDFIFYLWLYFWVSRVPLNVVESAFYRAKTVIVPKSGIQNWWTLSKIPLERRKRKIK